MAEESSSSKAPREVPTQTAVYNQCTVINAAVNNQSGQAITYVADSQMNIGGSHVTKNRAVSKTPKRKKIKKSPPELQTPLKMTAKQASAQRERLEDVFQDEIIKAFADITSFKKFARSKNGLCLDEHVIQSIVEDHDCNVEEQKIQILNKWREIKGKKATVLEIRHLLQKYFKEDIPSGYIVLENGIFGVYKTRFLCKRSNVYLGEQKSEISGTQTRAIKFVPKNEINLREAQILVKLRNHGNVVSIIHAGIHHAVPYDYIYIVMEHSWTQTVRNMIKLRMPFNEFNAWRLVEQLMRAVEFLHSYNIIHRDLKPDNVLASPDWRFFKVTDFELSKEIQDGSATNQTNANTGTEGYRSRETYDHAAKITVKTDIFSAGATIGEIMANGKHPFGEDPDLWTYNIKQNKFNLRDLCVDNKDQVISLIKPMLEMDPEKRPTAKKVLNDVSRHFQTFQLNNQQTTTDESLVLTRTTADESSATTSKAITEPSITEKVLTGTTADEILSSTSKAITELSITEKVNAIIMFNRIDEHMYSFNLSTKESSRMQVYPVWNSSILFTTVVSGKHLYFMQNQKVHQLEYSDSAAKWKEMSSMKEDHGWDPPAVMLNGFIYVCGSSGSADASRSVERYDAAQNQWDRMCDMNTARKYHCFVATEDHIYCIGGRDKQYDQLQSVEIFDERFDERLNKWEFVKSAPRQIWMANGAVVKNRIYVTTDPIYKVVVCYDIQNNSWSEIDPPIQWPFSRSGAIKILAVDDELYIIGIIRDSKGKSKDAIYLLEPETKQINLIEEFEDKNINRHACLAVKL